VLVGVGARDVGVGVAAAEVGVGDGVLAWLVTVAVGVDGDPPPMFTRTRLTLAITSSWLPTMLRAFGPRNDVAQWHVKGVRLRRVVVRRVGVEDDVRVAVHRVGEGRRANDTFAVEQEPRRLRRCQIASIDGERG